MAERPTTSTGGPAHATAGYDTTPVNVKAITWLIVCFTAALIAVLAGLWWFEARLVPDGHPPEIQILQVEQPLQPSPGHPLLPWEDMRAMRQSQELQLHSYGASAGNPARIHIPIDQAFDLLLQSGDLQRPWQNPSIPPYQMETQPSPWIKPPVRNGT